MHRNGKSSSRGEDEQAKLKRILNDLTKKEENKFCADCGCRGPRWASINLGVFICIGCSGIHRSLGVHLTFVRSVNLDSWTPDQVAQMKRWGNARAKAYFEANVPSDHRRPNEQSSAREKELWIRAKYEQRAFVRQDGKEPAENGEEEEEQPTRRSRRRSGARKREEEQEKKKQEEERANSRRERRRAAQESAPAKPAPQTTSDMISFDDFDTPSQPQQQQQAPAQVAPKPAEQDEWASFSGSSNSQAPVTPANTNDMFSKQPDQYASRMANIMSSFGPSPAQNPGMQQPQMGMNNGFGMMPPAPMQGNMPMMMQGQQYPQQGFPGQQGMMPQGQQYPQQGQQYPQQGFPGQQGMMQQGQQFHMQGYPGQQGLMQQFPQQQFQQPNQMMMQRNGYPMQPNANGFGGQGMQPMYQSNGSNGGMPPSQQQAPPQQKQQPNSLSQPFVNF